MRHLQAGLVIGAIWLAMSIVAVLIIALIDWLAGPTTTLQIAITTIAVVVTVTLVDWYTERRGT